MGAKRRWFAGTAGLGAVIAGTAMLGSVQSGAQNAAAAPKARYVMDVGTVSGFGGNPMAMAMGRGSSVQHELTLRLGSTLAPAGGAAQADHFMPPAARLGASVPLETPRAMPSGPAEPGTPQNFERPRGRLLLFWGCGAHAGPGQPVVIDFAKVAQGQMPPGLFSANVPVETGPMPGNSRTYGTWPNSMGQRRLEGGSSILGQHSVKGNYTPAIGFSLAQDFMQPLNARATPSEGGFALSWGAVPNATGYYAWAMGAKDMGRGQGGDMVWWTSANAREFGAGLWDWLSPGTVARLINQKVVMPPSQTSCAVPAEVKAAAGEMLMTNLTAYGPEANFANPPRPADPKIPWRPDWTVKVRYRATTMVMAGMPAFGGREDAGDDDDRPSRSERQQPERKCRPGLGGMLGGVLGGRGC